MSIEIHGRCDAGFEAVRDAFRRHVDPDRMLTVLVGKPGEAAQGAPPSAP